MSWVKQLGKWVEGAEDTLWKATGVGPLAESTLNMLPIPGIGTFAKKAAFAASPLSASLGAIKGLAQAPEIMSYYGNPESYKEGPVKLFENALTRFY